MTCMTGLFAVLLNSVNRIRKGLVGISAHSSLSLYSFSTFLRNISNFQASPAKQNGKKRRLQRLASKNILYQFQHFRKITVWYSNINREKKEILLQRCLSAHALCISCLRQKFSVLFMKPISYRTGMSSRHCILMNFSLKKKEILSS